MQEKLIIGCDLFLDLKLYQLPELFLKKIRKKFPNIQLLEFNTPNSNLLETDKIDIYWGNRITKKLISKLTSLKWIHFGSVGFNAALTSQIIEREIKITNSSGIMTNAVISSGLGFIFLLARGFHHSIRIRQNNLFSRKAFDLYFNQIQDVIGQSVLIAGFGKIGKAFAKSCDALGLRVSIVRKNHIKKPKWVHASYSIYELDKAVKNADYIVNLLPLTDETHGVFTKNIFMQMKRNAFFINIGRGDTVVENDLVYVLKNNLIAGAGIDVFSSTSYVNYSVPLYPDSPLFDLDNVILTPHISGLTRQYWEKEVALFINNLERFIHKKKLANEISIKEFLTK